MERVTGNYAMFASPPHGAHAVKHNNVLLLKDLILPKSGPWSKYNVEHRGLLDMPERHLIVLGILQSAVSNEMITQVKEFNKAKALIDSCHAGDKSLHDTIVSFVEADKMLRLLRSPTQIAHCDTKSNRVGLSHTMKVWYELQELMGEIQEKEEIVQHEETEETLSSDTDGDTVFDGPFSFMFPGLYP